MSCNALISGMPNQTERATSHASLSSEESKVESCSLDRLQETMVQSASATPKKIGSVIYKYYPANPAQRFDSIWIPLIGQIPFVGQIPAIGHSHLAKRRRVCRAFRKGNDKRIPHESKELSPCD